MNAILSDFGIINVLDRGADPTGNLDSTTAFLSAYLIAGQTGLGRVYIPGGKYLLTGLILSQYNNVKFIGSTAGDSAYGGTLLINSNTSEPIITVSNVSGIWFENIGFTSSQQMTASSLILFNNGTNYCGMSDFHMDSGFNGITIDGGGEFWLRRGSIRNFNNYGIYVTNNAADIYCTNIIMDQDSSTFTPQAGVYTDSTGGSLNITDSDILHCHNGFWANPGIGNFVNWVYMSNVYFDTADFSTNGAGGGCGIKITPNNGGIFNGGSLVNVWTATATIGIYAVGDATSQLSGLQLTNWIAFNNWQEGGYFDYCDHLSIANQIVAGNGQETPQTTYSGIFIGSHNGYYVSSAETVSSSYSFVGGSNGSPIEGYGNTQKFGFFIDSGFSGTVQIIGINLSGNYVSSIYNGGSPASGSIINNCIGYNPQGITSISVGASPFYYTAGLAAESISIYGGSGIVCSIGDIAIINQSPASFVLQPLQTVAISYSTAPTVISNKS